MALFEKAYGITAGHEGGYAHNPADTGGETYSGISRKWNPAWPGWAKVDAVTQKTRDVKSIDRQLRSDAVLEEVIARFYRQNYWDTLRLSEVTSQVIAEKLYDISVNMGVRKAALILQEALNLTNQNGRAYPDISEDGQVGPTTLRMANNHPRDWLLLKVVQALQAERYLNIMRANGTQEVFAATWFSRV